MARPKSEDKRNAILDAAIAVFAERGVWSTPTAAISKAAGVAEGTLFTYFATKEVLVNELYRALKIELADVLLASFPKSADVRAKFQHIWNRYVDWGLTNSAKLKVLSQLQISDQITIDSKAIGRAPYAEIERMEDAILASKHIRDYPVAFIATMFIGMAETTIAAIAQDKHADVDFSALGFEMFWNSISTR